MFSFHTAATSILLTALSCFAAADGHQVQLYTVNFPPYTIIDPQNNIRGIDVEVVTAAFAAVGIQATISAAPWKRIIKNMQHGKIVGSLSCARNPLREAFMLFSAPTSENTRVAITTKEFDASKLVSLADLHHYQVIAIGEWGVEQQLSANSITHSTTPDIASGIRSVVYRNVDIFYNVKLPTIYQARNLGLLDKIKIHHFQDGGSTPLHLCLSKDYPGNQALLDQFNSGLSLIKRSGEFAAIYKKYERSDLQ